MISSQPPLPLWDDPAESTPSTPAPLPAHLARILADSTDRVGWLRARSRGITATDVAKLATERSVRTVVDDKWHGSRFSGNAFTDHGREREPEIARWVSENFGIQPSTALFHAEGSRAHLATPDGLSIGGPGLHLAEIKTTSSAWRSIPRGYLRQVWWQQYVLGAERTLLVWEQHRDFVPVDAEPQYRWIDRDDSQIHMLVRLADQVLEALAQRSRG
ncbi:YqaJ viral recombinase family protein [Salinibacterium hongtaonis]|uniref:YqaJ viral recombinase family protein n=1 Tax=Homoserinimonas hongtaonis TaxID=2079791 RepID=UPI001E2CA6A9|nr:YqaJ viral recombinase family protein [Salinibacterium hongtaonis]